MIKILVVDPIVKSKLTEHVNEAYWKPKADDIALHFTCLERGPRFIETEENEKSAIPDLLRVINNGEKQGYDAIIINCFGNPGLEEARSLVKIPVIGAGEASFLKMKTAKKKFSVITTVQEAVPRVARNARKHSAEQWLVSIRPLGMHVLELIETKRLRRALLTEGKKALQEDQAETIVLGCTGMAGNAEWLSKKLSAPIIDPTRASLEMTIELLKSKSNEM